MLASSSSDSSVRSESPCGQSWFTLRESSLGPKLSPPRLRLIIVVCFPSQCTITHSYSSIPRAKNDEHKRLVMWGHAGHQRTICRWLIVNENTQSTGVFNLTLKESRRGRNFELISLILFQFPNSVFGLRVEPWPKTRPNRPYCAKNWTMPYLRQYSIPHGGQSLMGHHMHRPT